MKRIKILALLLLPVILTSCNKEDNSSNKEKEKTVVDRWVPILESNIKLTGRVIENITSKDGEHQSCKYKEIRAYSDGKFYAISDSYNEATKQDSNTAMKYCSDENGNVVFKYLNERNEIITNTLLDKYNNPISFSDIYVNPFIDVEYNCNVNILEDDPHSFILEDDIDYDNVNDICQNLTLLDIDFTSIIFTENENQDQLSIKIKSESKKINGFDVNYTYEFTLSEIEQAFIEPKKYSETEESKRLDSVLKSLSEKESYTISRKTESTYLDQDYTWNVLIEPDKTYNQQTMDGVFKNSDGKYYCYSYNQDYLKTLSDPIEKYSENSYLYRPDFSKFSAAVFKNNYDSKTQTITYMLQNSLEDFVKSNIITYLLEDNASKKYAYNNPPTYLKLILDKDNNLTMTYQLVNYDTSNGGGTVYFTTESYSFSNFNNTTIEDFQEQYPSNIKEIAWEVIKDPTSTDAIIKDGLSVKLTIDENNIPQIEFKINDTLKQVTDIRVENGVVSFTANSKTWQISYLIDENSYNVSAYIECVTDNSKQYSLTEVGLEDVKDGLIIKINEIDPNDYSDQQDEYNNQTDKEFITTIKTKAIKYVSEANTISDAQGWYNAWEDVLQKHPSIYQKQAMDEIDDYRYNDISKTSKSKKEKCEQLAIDARDDILKTHNRNQLTLIVTNYKADIDAVLDTTD